MLMQLVLAGSKAPLHAKAVLGPLGLPLARGNFRLAVRERPGSQLLLPQKQLAEVA
jgi:hypothetical protein